MPGTPLTQSSPPPQQQQQLQHIRMRRGEDPQGAGKITPEQFDLMVEHLRKLDAPRLGNIGLDEYKEWLGRRLGYSKRSINAWHQSGKFPLFVDWMFRIRYNYNEFTRERVEQLPLPPSPPIVRSSWSLLALVMDLEEASRLGRRVIGSYYREWHSAHWGWWSPELRRLWGVDDDAALTYDLWLSALHRDDRARVERRMRRFMRLAAGQLYEEQFRVINLKDRTEHHVRSHSRMVSRDGKPVTSAGYIYRATDKP